MLCNIFFGVLADNSLLSVDPGLIIWTVITFIILVLILKAVAWKPILSALDQRENTIKDALEQADKARLEAQKLVEQNKADMAKADDAAKETIEQGRIYGEKLKEELIQKAREEADRLRIESNAEIQRRKNEAMGELKSQIAEIAIQAAEKILREKLDEKENSKLVDKFLSDIKSN